MSYAQNHEDVVLARCFPGTGGFYIDVGAANPVAHSVTKWFSTRGWTGVNVEPHPLFFKMIEADRPSEFNVHAAVSDAAGELTYYEVPDSLGRSTLNPDWAEIYRQQGHAIVTHVVRTVTLTELCERYVRGPIDFLKVDAEGHELQVLRSMDFERWKPRVVVVEATIDNWNHILLANGYRFGLYDGVNRYYVHDGHRELLPVIASPVHSGDDYEVYEYAERIRQLEQALAEAHQRETLARQQEALARQQEALVRQQWARVRSAYVPRRAYDALLALYRENRQHVDALRRAGLKGPSAA
jgi:FkbM family methyltransferase